MTAYSRLGRPFEWVIAREERRTRSQLDYLRTFAAGSPGAFLRLGAIRPMAWYRKAASADAYATARIAAEDADACNACLQIAMTLARADGADPAVIEAARSGRLDALPDPLARVYVWARAVIDNDPANAALGDDVEAALGRAVRAELALGLSISRVFPVLRRGLGHGQACAVPGASG